MVARSLREAQKLFSAKLSVHVDENAIRQDADVLDTWFSSGAGAESVFLVFHPSTPRPVPFCGAGMAGRERG